MATSKIEWTDRSDWNPIRGCTRVSPGCGGPGPHGGCYAEAMAARFSDPGQWGHGFAERTPKGGRWTGLVTVQWDRIDLPLRWRTPADIFASSTSDFFHEALEMDDIAQLFGVMIAAHHLHGHRFQVLTKRGHIMRRWLNDPQFWEIANAAAGAHIMERVDPLNRRSDDARATCDDYGPDSPPPGIWLGVSVEDQRRADERIPDLLATPAAVRWLSCEPLLGAVDLRHVRRYNPTGKPWIDALRGLVTRGQYLARSPSECSFATSTQCIPPELPRLDWIVAGGESGPGARPCHPDWARSLRDQCRDAGVPFFFKQWGEWAPAGQSVTAGATIREFRQLDGHRVHRVGKKAAGRLLDGVEHNGMPAQ